MSPDLSYICPVNKIITMKRNWIGSSMIVALFALLASGCGHSQRTLEFRGICVDDPQGENGLYNPFTLEIGRPGQGIPAGNRGGCAARKRHSYRRTE